jgi:hypothetical protein
MRKTSNFIRAIIGVAIIISVIVFIWIRKPKMQTGVVDNVPYFETTDFFGQPFASSRLNGKCVYIQFTNFMDPSEKGHLASIVNNWKYEELTTIIVSSEIDKIQSTFNIMPKGNVILLSNCQYVMNIFRVNSYGRYLIFDRTGRLVSTGNSDQYECLAKLVLKNIVRNERFAIEELFDTTTTLFSVEGFDILANIINEEDKKIGVLALFNRICDTCSGGPIIAKLKKIYDSRKRTISILLMVNEEFTKDDIENLKSHLDIRFPVIAARGVFGNKWTQLINEYCDNELSDILIAFNKNGKIVKYADKKCNCINGFFDYLDNFDEKSGDNLR